MPTHCRCSRKQTFYAIISVGWSWTWLCGWCSLRRGIWPHYSAFPATALAESTREDPVQACCPCVQNVYTVVSRRFRGLEKQTSALLPHCPSYTSTHRRWSGLPYYCYPYFRTVYPTCHVRTLYVCFPRSPKVFPFKAFLPMTFTETFVVPAQWQLRSDSCHFRTLKSFFLLTYSDMVPIRSIWDTKGRYHCVSATNLSGQWLSWLTWRGSHHSA